MDILLSLNLCFGYQRGLSIFSCDEFYQVYNRIIERSKDFEYCFIINDLHSPDDGEFSFLPKHCIKGSHDCLTFPHLESQIKSKYVIKLSKSTLSAVKNQHNLQTILSTNPKGIYVSGFSTSIDLVPTVLDLLGLCDIHVDQALTGDISKEHKDRALQYLSQFINIKHDT
jgi:nicotinamidase-related amidase